MGMCQAGSRRAPLHLAEAEVLVPPSALSLSLEMMVNYRDYYGIVWICMDVENGDSLFYPPKYCQMDKS